MNLNNLSLENIGDWPKTVKYTILAVLSLIIFSLGYFFDINSQLSQLDKQISQEEQLKLQLTANYSTIKLLRQDTLQAEAINNLYNQLKTKLITPNKLADLLEKISKIGANNQVKFNLLKPLPEKPESFYTKVPLKIVVTGNYDELANFISELANLNHFLTFDQFSLMKKVISTNNNTLINSTISDELELDLVSGIYYSSLENPEEKNITKTEETTK